MQLDKKSKRVKKRIFFYYFTHLGIDTDNLVALLTSVGEYILVTLDAIGMIITYYITLAGQALIALPATKMARMPILIHGLRIFTTEN